MIKADHKKWARSIFNIFIDRELKKNFSNFYQVNEMPPIDENSAMVFTPNHISWWDGFFIDYVGRKLTNRKLHIMMLEEQLKRYWFFQKLGAYSLNPTNPKSIVETGEYTREIISDSKNFTVIYPQGEIEPFEKKPLSLRQGLKVFLKNPKLDTYIIPAAFKIHYENEKHPAIYFRFGDAVNSNVVIENYEVFKTEFLDNINKLSEAAVDKLFIRDHFG